MTPDLLVVVPTFNRPDLLRRCLHSIATQEGEFTVIVADDASTDDMTNVLWEYGIRPGWLTLMQPFNVGALVNIADAIALADPAPDTIIVLIDGDDTFAHPRALVHIRHAYSADIELCYGSYVSAPSDPLTPACRPIPLAVLEAGTIRAWSLAYGMWANHPLSFRRRLFDAMSAADFLGDDGEPMRRGYDVALLCPLIELAGVRVRWLPDVLYVYSAGLPDSCVSVAAAEVHANNLSVLTRAPQHLPADFASQ